MSWRDGRDSCTCSCTLTGLPAQIPTELRRGSANKTQTVILEVPTCLTPHILTSSPRPTNSNNNYNLLLLLLLFTTTTTTTITHFCRVVYHPSDKLNISNSVSLRTDTTSPLSLSLFLSHSHSLSFSVIFLRESNYTDATRTTSSSKLVETDPVFVADGHEVCRIVLLRELCKCRNLTTES